MTNKACAVCIGFRQKIARLERAIAAGENSTGPALLGLKANRQKRDEANWAFSVHARQVHGR